MVSTGIKELDRIIGGGYPVPSTILIEGPVESEKERLLYKFLQSDVFPSDSYVFVTNSNRDEVLKDASANGIDIGGGTTWVSKEGGQVVCNIDDLASLSFSLKDLLRKHEGQTIRVAFDILSPILMRNSPESVYKFLDQLAAEIKRHRAILLATLERGMHPLQITAAMEQLFDGVISLETELRDNRSLSLIRVRKMKGVAISSGAQAFVSEQSNAEVPYPGLEELALDKHRIAVLPFANLSPDPDDGYFADGMTEELITALSRIKELSVIARTSVMVYKDRSRKVSEIGRDLSVGKIVEGSVRKAGDKVRLTVQLVDAQTEGHLWAKSYDKELKDIFGIQSDIAHRVARALRVRLASEGTGHAERRVVGSEAYILYLKGMQFRNKASEDGWRKAIEFFEKAIRMEPTFADAIAALSICHCWLAYFAFDPPGKAYEEAKRLANDALKISDVADAHLSIYFVLFYHEAKWREAELELRRSLELNPSSPEAHNNYSFWLANFGRTDDAISEAEKALELDPLSEISHVVTADVYAWVRKYDRAISKFRAVLDINPKLPIAHNDLGVAYLAMGKIQEGVEELEKAKVLSEGSPFFRVNLGYGYALSGRREEALRIADELKGDYSKRLLPAYFVAVVYAGLGENQEALDWLEKAYNEGAVIFTPLLHIEPEFARLRDEPRFKALLAKLGLPSQAPVPL